MHEEKQKEPIRLELVIFTEIDEDLAMMADRIKSHLHDDLYLVIPRASLLFKSDINLRMIKEAAAEAEKELTIVTMDETGAELAKTLGMPVISNLQGELACPVKNRNKKLLRNAAPIMRFSKERPQKRENKKVSINELKQTGQAESASFAEILKEKMRGYRKTKQKRELLAQNPHRQALFGLIVGGIALLAFIVYIALPHATIYVVPNKQVIEQSVNVTLANARLNTDLLATNPRRVLPTYKLGPFRLSKNLNYRTTGKIFEGENARGLITVINSANREWDFVPRTQFHTADGLIFRATNYISVPAATAAGPGRVDVEVVADPFDTGGQAIGERGNIGPSEFVIAKLSADSQELVYGESAAAMTGGKTITRTQVTQEDFDNALELAKKQLIEEIPTVLTAKLAESEQLSEFQLKLLDVPGTIQYSEPEASADEAVIGTETAEFSVKSSLEATGYAYDPDQMLIVLKNELLLRESPDKQIAQIDAEGLTFRFFKEDEETGQIELTATIKGVEAYDLDPNEDTGINLIKKIKDHVAGLRTEEAIAYIENLPEIERVKITRWPFWAPTLPNFTENIRFVVEEVEQLEIDAIPGYEGASTN